jgi:hypothetical protein
VVFNARTVKLIDYAEKLKHRNKKRDRADKLKLRLGMNHPEVKTVIAEETDATDLLDQSRDEFDSYQDKVKQEIRLFERQKRDDVTRAIKNYVKLSIRYEQTQLNTLEKTLSDMQEPFTARQPFLGYQKMSPPSINSQAESSSSRQQKKRRQQHQNYKELHKTLQSSSSLPTRNRRSSSDQEVSDSSESTQQKRDDHNNNRISLSASYDERLSTTHRFT